MIELALPTTVERRNKLDISLGYCNDVEPEKLLSLGQAIEVHVDSPEQLIDFLLQDAEPERLYFVNHLPFDGKEWEYACFAKLSRWTFFSSVFSTALAYNPIFADGRRRRLACGGTRIIARQSLEKAAHADLGTLGDELVAALRMNLYLSEAMTGKNLSNGFNVGGSKSLVHVQGLEGRFHVKESETREFARFIARAQNSITQHLPVFIGTGSDLNFHEHGELYYDLCSRISPNYTGSRISARRWNRATSGNTTVPTAAGVIACLDAVTGHLGVPQSERAVLIKGLGGVGLAVARWCAERGWRVHATELNKSTCDQARVELGSHIQFVEEERWGDLSGVTVFSPNAAAASVTKRNLPVLARMGVKAIVGGENNIREKDVPADAVYREHGILTFADFLLNGGGAWIVGAEMVERPVEAVHDWITKYQVPTVLATIEIAKEQGRSPESIFLEFIARRVRELLA